MTLNVWKVKYIFTVKLQRFKKLQIFYKCYLKSNILKNPLGHIPYAAGDGYRPVRSS